MPTSLLFAPLLLAAPAIDPDDLRPGLVAVFRDGAREVVRLEPTVALNLKPGDAAHPSLSADGGTARWTGHINLIRAGDYRFAAVLHGSLKVRVGGKEVLAAESASARRCEGPAVKLEAGVQSFEADYVRPANGSARVELWWRGPGFREEPLPADAVGHLPKQAEAAKLADHDQRERGRLLAEEHGCANCHRPAADDRM